MVKHLTLDLRRSRPDRVRAGARPPAARVMLFMFTLGILAGSVTGAFFTADGLALTNAGQYVSVEALPSTFPLALWNSARFFLILALAATSWIGVMLAPAAVLLRGYLFGCTVSALYAAYGWTGLRCAFLVSGLPALFLAPAFLIAACDAFFASRWLLERRFGLVPALPGRRAGRRAVVIALLVLSEAIYGFYLLPRLLAG